MPDLRTRAVIPYVGEIHTLRAAQHVERARGDPADIAETEAARALHRYILDVDTVNVPKGHAYVCSNLFF